MSLPKQRQKNIGENNKTSLWYYFKKSEGGENAICLTCSNLLKISQRSTTGLKTHLKTKHCIDIGQLRQNTVLAPKASTSKVSVIEEEIPKKKSKTIDGYIIKENSMEKMVSRMVCKDGFSFNSFCTSSDLRHLFSTSGFQLPNSPNTIRSTVINFSNTVKADMIIELTHLKKQSQIFSLSFDERTSQKNHRYLNLNVHHKDTHFNLGLIRIRRSCTAKHCIRLIKDRLTIFGLDFETDIIGMTTDGASVMVKVGKLVPCYQQMCFAHGIQLAVVDTLYKEIKREAELTEKTLNDLDIDDDEDTEETNEEQGLTVTIDRQPAEVIPGYNDLIEKVRKVVKIFRSSPNKENMYLQKHVKKETGKELSLILDCCTRWDSLHNMLDRFYSLKVCIEKALNEIASDIKFTDEEWSIIKELIDGLQLFKLGVEVLCRKESTLITADTIFRFILEKLKNQDTVLSAELSEALRVRVKERRTEVTGILVYLQNPKKYDQELKTPDYTFTMPKNNKIRQEMKNILCRVIKNDLENVEVVAVADESQTSLQNNLTLQQELEMQIKQDDEDCTKQTETIKEKDFEKVLKKEMTAYETDGVKGKYLTLVHNYLLTIKPTSVEVERAFSAAGYIRSSIRSRLGDNTIDAICFLRSFFQKEK